MLIFKCNSEASNELLWKSEASFHKRYSWVWTIDGFVYALTELVGFSSSTESYRLNHSVKSSTPLAYVSNEK